MAEAGGDPGCGLVEAPQPRQENPPDNVNWGCGGRLMGEWGGLCWDGEWRIGGSVDVLCYGQKNYSIGDPHCLYRLALNNSRGVTGCLFFI